jgi:hypothetical protein
MHAAAKPDWEDFMTRTLVAVAAVLLVAVPARAQFETATVLGTVRDSTAAVVPDGTVTLTNMCHGGFPDQKHECRGEL